MDTRRALPSQARDLQDGVSLRALLAVLRRRRLQFLLPALLITAGFAAAAYLLPSRYRATALLEVEPTSLQAQEEPAPPQLEAEGQLTRITEILHQRALLEPVLAELFPPASGRAREQALQDLKAGIQVRVEGPTTFSLAFEDREPQRARDVVQRLSDLLIAATQAERAERTGAAVGFVEGQLAALETKMGRDEQRIEQYKASVVSELPEQVPAALERLNDVEERLHQASASIAELQARRAAIRHEMAELSRLGIAKPPAESRIEEARLALKKLENRYTDEHPEVLRARAELAEIEAVEARNGAGSAGSSDPSPMRLRHLQLASELGAVEQRLPAAEAERSALLAESAGLRRRIEAAPRHEMALAGMDRDYETTRSQHEALLKEVNEARRAQRLEETRKGGFRVAEAPRVPSTPVAPGRARILLMGILAGLGVGIAAAFVAEQVDPSFRDVEEFTTPSRLPVLGTIPSLAPRTRLPLGARRTLRQGVAVLDEPHGAAAEQYRIVATKLIRRKGAPQPTTVLVTSSMIGEGKTTTAVNIALALSRIVRDEPVLLVDVDLGRPAVHRLLHLPLGNGLARLLASPEEDPRAYARSHHGIYLLEAGAYSPETQAALASPKAQLVFERLRRRFPYMILDAPPVLAAAESLVLQQMVDSILLVVRAGTTRRELVWRALESLDPARTAGFLLNDVAVAAAYAYPYREAAPAERSAFTEGRLRC